MATSPQWRYEPRSAKRQREAEEFAKYAAEQGQEYLAPTQPATPKRRDGLLRRAVGAAGDAFKFASSGVSAMDTIDKRIPIDILGNDQGGTSARRLIEKAPVVGDLAGTAFDIGASPATLATAGAGGVVGGFIRGGAKGVQGAAKAGLLRRAAASLVEPISAGGLPTRLAVETAAGTAGVTAAEKVGEMLPEDTPGPVRTGAAIVAGLAGGVGAVGAIRGVEKTLASEGVDTLARRLATEELGAIGRQADDVPAGSVRLYRGDSTDVKIHALSKSDPNALFGSGIYLTDSPRVAGDYGAKGADRLFTRTGGTKEQAIDAYVRSKAQSIDENGASLGFGQTRDLSLTWDPTVKARLAKARELFEAEKSSLDIRKMTDGTVVIRRKANLGVRTTVDVPEGMVNQTIDADAEIATEVASRLRDVLRSLGDGSTADDMWRFATTVDDDGFRPSFRDVYTKIGAGSQLISDEGQVALRQAMKGLGYKGIRYQGGVTMGGKKHQAFVFWDEQGLAKMRPGTGAAKKPGLTPTITPDDIHKLADARGIPWDNDPAFLARTKRVTGKEHLDDLTPEELQRVADDLMVPAQNLTSADPIADSWNRGVARDEYTQGMAPDDVRRDARWLVDAPVGQIEAQLADNVRRGSTYRIGDLEKIAAAKRANPNMTDEQALDVLAQTEAFGAKVRRLRGSPDVVPARVPSAGDGGVSPPGAPPPTGLPPRPPRAAEPPTGGPPDPASVLDELLPSERKKPGIGLLRRYEGAVNAQGLAISRELDEGNRMLAQAKVGNRLGKSRNVGRTPEVEQLYRALHGEGMPPPQYRAIFDDLQRVVADETEKTLDFDPKFMAHPDYFPRGWRAPKETKLGASRMGSTPGFKKPRTDATFSEMLDAGWEPLSWNPYEMLALRRVAGAEFREQTKLVNHLRDLDVAVPVEGPIPDGFRVPKVGPAFEGKPKIAPQEDGPPQFFGYTPQHAVPDNIADALENMYGTPMRMAVGNVDVLKGIRTVSGLTKRAKLVGSLFQQVDFTTRTGFAVWGGAIDDLLSGKPLSAVAKAISLPAEMGKLAWANTSLARRQALRSQILSGDNLVKGRSISLKGIAEQGWRSQDITIIPRDIKGALNDFLEAPPPGSKRATIAKATDYATRAEKAMQDGLFDGVYPQAQIIALKNLIVPRLVRQHPDWNDAQIMANAATEANKMFSTLGDFQTIFKNRGMRELTRNLFFSTNETEALVRQAFSTIVGPNKRMWAEFYVGGALFLGATANLVHLAATGEPLPLDRYTPIKKDPFGPLPVGYNSAFLSPDVPGLKGRAGTQVAIDLMGQMDTVFRILNPQSFIEGRTSVPIRALMNQQAGEDFYGRKLEGPKERIQQLASDTLAPIGAGNILGAFDIGPENEGRLGRAGQLVQASGANLRAESNATLRERKAQEKYGKPWAALGPADRMELEKSDPAFTAEMQQRRETAAERGDEYGQAGVRAREVKATLNRRQEADDRLLMAGTLTRDQWIKQYQDRRAELRFRQDEIWKDTPKGPARDAVGRFFQALNESEDPDTGIVDWDKVDSWVAQQSTADQSYIDANTGLGGTAMSQLYRKLAKVKGEYYELPKYRGYTSGQAREIDTLYATIAAVAGSSADGKMLRALRQYAAANGLTNSDPTVKATRRLILGMVKPAKDRERFAKKNPALSIFDSFTRAPLTAKERELVSSLLADPDIQRRAAA